MWEIRVFYLMFKIYIQNMKPGLENFQFLCLQTLVKVDFLCVMILLNLVLNIYMFVVNFSSWSVSRKYTIRQDIECIAVNYIFKSAKSSHQSIKRANSTEKNRFYFLFSKSDQIKNYKSTCWEQHRKQCWKFEMNNPNVNDLSIILMESRENIYIRCPINQPLTNKFVDKHCLKLTSVLMVIWNNLISFIKQSLSLHVSAYGLTLTHNREIN